LAKRKKQSERLAEMRRERYCPWPSDANKFTRKPRGSLERKLGI